jgi:hypothetical protein
VRGTIPEPHPYDPDDPADEESVDDFSFLLPGRSQRNDLIDPLDPLEY